jgi:hypothetical protein
MSKSVDGGLNGNVAVGKRSVVWMAVFVEVCWTLMGKNLVEFVEVYDGAGEGLADADSELLWHAAVETDGAGIG